MINFNYLIDFIAPYFTILTQRKSQENFRYFFKKVGLEIGGPSNIFQHKLPVYKLAKKIDGVNFSNHTFWEGNITDGGRYRYFKRKAGKQFVQEAQNLKKISDNSYDFVISSHCLEHCANPIAALKEWKRVLKPNGHILILVPNKEYTFDHGRKVTNFEHLKEDYNNEVGEEDLTHLDEILQLHDLEMDKPAGTVEAFRKRSLKNFENRFLHHHVFDKGLLKELLRHQNFKIIKSWSFDELHHAIIGRKV